MLRPRKKSTIKKTETERDSKRMTRKASEDMVEKLDGVADKSDIS